MIQLCRCPMPFNHLEFSEIPFLAVFFGPLYKKAQTPIILLSPSSLPNQNKPHFSKNTQSKKKMKIQCDVCHKQEASFFCPADEAALCNECDHTIHFANKLASKHKRFSLHHPTSKYTPLCDICHEKRAYLFCQEDRSILCRECDLSIHLANEYTKKHNRFLLTGIKISASSSSDSKYLSSISKINRTSSFSSSSYTFEDNKACETVSTSSISEYLIETIPGYCMEELFDASFESNDYEKNRDLQTWVPESQVRSHQVSAFNVPQIDSLDGVLEVTQTKKVDEGYLNWRYNGYSNAWKVPSIITPKSASKTLSFRSSC